MAEEPEDWRQEMSLFQKWVKRDSSNNRALDLALT